MKAELPRRDSQRGRWVSATMETKEKKTPSTMPEIATHCPFCSLPSSRIISEDSLFLVIRGAYPISPGHRLIISKRHMASLPFS